MATPVTLKKIDDKKAAAQKRKDRLTDQLLPLGVGSDAPYAHLLVSGQPNPAPRMMDLRPLSAQFTQFRPRKMDFSVDRPNGQNYTSFEGGNEANDATQRIGGGDNNNGKQRRYNGGGGARALEKQLKKLIIEESPAELPAVEYTVRSNNLVCFRGKEHFLSTLFPVKITIDGHEYPSVEHYYQACKIFSLVGPDQAQMLRYIPDTLKVKQKAKDILYSWNITNDTIEHWKNSTGLLVLLHGTRHKFSQSEELRKKLLATGDALLCQAYDRDAFYAVGMNETQLREWIRENEGKVLKFPSDLTDEKVKYIPIVGKGKNVLGVICMQVRNAIKNHEEDVPKVGAGAPLSLGDAATATKKKQSSKMNGKKTTKKGGGGGEKVEKEGEAIDAAKSSSSDESTNSKSSSSGAEDSDETNNS